MKKYGEELKQEVLEVKERFQKTMADRWERISAGWTDEDDCWLSIKVDEDAVYECDLQLEILDTDGMMDYDAVFDQDGKEVRIHYFVNKWRKQSVVGRGIFASTLKALLEKTGWTEKTIRVPVWTKFVASACFGRTEKVRWHTNMVTGEYFGYPD